MVGKGLQQLWALTTLYSAQAMIFWYQALAVPGGIPKRSFEGAMAHHEPVWGGLGWWEPVSRVAQPRGHICRGSPVSLGALSFFLFLLSDALAGFELVCLERVGL